jgi:hypothetical protein
MGKARYNGFFVWLCKLIYKIHILKLKPSMVASSASIRLFGSMDALPFLHIFNRARRQLNGNITSRVYWLILNSRTSPVNVSRWPEWKFMTFIADKQAANQNPYPYNRALSQIANRKVLN